MKKPRKKLTLQQGRFVEYMANPAIKSQTEAAIKAGCPPKNARITASKWLTKSNIREAIEERKQRVLEDAKVTPEEVFGHAVFSMRSSIADVLDEKGGFDPEKARETGAIDLVKRYRKKTRIDRKTGNKEEMTEIEMYSSADARKEVAGYMGLDKGYQPAKRK